ncbi:hypothetical protein [Kocuria sabuli]|uniref:hypothetical protein n=1 Tax=Kocuria sabuli TaxID=3071448 RepID=UPI0034D52829
MEPAAMAMAMGGDGGAEFNLGPFPGGLDPDDKLVGLGDTARKQLDSRALGYEDTDVAVHHW